MIFTETRLQGAFILDLERREDSRGFFARTFCQREFEQHGLNPSIAQTNVAVSNKQGTLRGMHFQFPPAADSKLVRVTRGAILDVIIDLRPESSTYLQHVAVELSSHNGRALYVPERFAHGYQVLQEDTEMTYSAGDFYTPTEEGGVRYSDPRFGIAWPLPVTEIAPKDEAWPLFEAAATEIQRRMSLAMPARSSA
jgi:dTDP-4-dehydrorhamnose 3,5-epimerase